jgi:transposase
MGGVRFHDKKRVCFFIEKGNSDIFYEQLEQFNDFVKSEWVEQGNKESDFQTLGPKILIILDNASYHKKKDIWEKIENNLPNIQLYFLPAYSPDYNLIELVWHSALIIYSSSIVQISIRFTRTIRGCFKSGGYCKKAHKAYAEICRTQHLVSK